MGEPWISSLGRDQQSAGLLPEQRQIGYAPSQGSCPRGPSSPYEQRKKDREDRDPSHSHPNLVSPSGSTVGFLHKASHFILPGT